MKEFSIPSGMRDLVLGEAQRKKQLQLAIEAKLDRWGYEEVITPSVEYYQTYSVGFDNLQEESMYKFFDNSGRILALRSDMTIPIARVAATKFKDAKEALRFRYCANVFKVHETLSGNRNEITDCGIELIGVPAQQADLEIIVTALDALSVVGDVNITLEIGDIKFFQEACKSLGLSEKQQLQLADYVDRKSLKELETFLKEAGLSDDRQAFFNQLVWWNGDVSILEEAKQYAFNEELVAIIEKLQTLYAQLETLDYHQNIAFDLGKVGNLNYYTGIIFDAFAEGVGLRVMSGGRYDNLIKKYGNDVPAIGFSIKLDQLVNVYDDIDTVETIVIEFNETRVLEAIKKRQTYGNDKKVILKINNNIDEVIVKGETL